MRHALRHLLRVLARVMREDHCHRRMRHSILRAVKELSR